MRELQRFPRAAERIPETRFHALREAFGRWAEGPPEVSILLVARDEADYIVSCLASLAAFADPQASALERDEGGTLLVPGASPVTELIVVDNGSSDGTADLVERCGLSVVRESRVGIDFARQRALEEARGRFVLSVDADCLYPPGWGHDMVRILREEPEQACLYGNHRFIPDRDHTAWSLALYRWLAEPVKSFRSVRHEYVNALGCNMAFRRLDATRVGGWMRSPELAGSGLESPASEGSPDGRLALRLSVFGRLLHLDGPRNTVWTSPRGLDTDGGLLPAFRKRMLRELRRSLPRRRTIVIE